MRILEIRKFRSINCILFENLKSRSLKSGKEIYDRNIEQQYLLDFLVIKIIFFHLSNFSKLFSYYDEFDQVVTIE